MKWKEFSIGVEIIPLAVNVIMALIAGYQGEWGKTTYWSGAAILTVGILMMRG
jgi:hypothetical protein